MSSPIEISLVSPVYNAESCVDELVRQMVTAVSALTPSYEIILVDDRSEDASWEKIRAFCSQNPRVRGVRLSRNFGQHKAITAGLQSSRGNYVILMDCDLQDDPRYFAELYSRAKAGVEVVFTSKVRRAHGPLKNLVSKFYGLIFTFLRGSNTTKVRHDRGTYSLISRKVVDAFLSVTDQQRHYLLILDWLGFSNDCIVVEHAPRFAGRSSYTLKKLLIHAMEGIVSHSDKLLFVSIEIGFGVFILSLFAVVYLIVGYFVHGYKEGWASVMIAITMSASLILMSLGVLGIYISKIFEQSKGRPLFIVEEHLNDS